MDKAEVQSVLRESRGEGRRENKKKQEIERNSLEEMIQFFSH